MSVLIQLTDGIKSYGDQLLLDSTSVTLYEDEKVGFIRGGHGRSDDAHENQFRGRGRESR